MLEKDFVYMVNYHWSDLDNDSIEIYIFSTKEKALEKVRNLIKDCMENYWNKVAYKNGVLDIENYLEPDTNIDDCEHTDYVWWYMEERYERNFDYINMKIMEIDQK